MTREEAIKNLEEWKECISSAYRRQVIDMAIEALQAKTDGDLIRRADAIEAVASRDETDGTVKVFTGRQVNEILSALPSAEVKTKCIAQIKIDRDDLEDLVNEKVNEIVDKMSEPKTGEWIFSTIMPTGYKCSVCGRGEFFHVDGFEFCPFCGADMRGEERE